MTSSKSNSYAFEIRFVDDKIVQVFDIAAKRQNEGTGLPTEYLQEDVLKGQLRYSKLVGSTASPTENLDEYQHQVTTKRSKNRRSIQRHTFFMMGGGGGGGGGDVGGDSSSQYLTQNDSREDHHRGVIQTSSSPIEPISPAMSLSPTIPMASTMQMSPTLPVTPSSPVPSLQVSLTSPAVSPPLSPLPQRTVSPPIPTLPQTAMMSSYKAYQKHDNRIPQYDTAPQYQYNTTTPDVNQILPIIPPAQEYYQEFNSIVMVDSNDYSSKMNIQQEEKMSSKKGGACCIIQ
ncbi:hypothetical protein EDC94DRAFT_658159 [Helicostylum pulchrum]|nr:hypothetical protein EDC94DRAFT_658159 [Helicostylum pulchrum]